MFRATSAPQGLKKVKQNNGSIITAVTAKEPESQVNLYSTSTEGEVEGSGEGRPELREGHDERLRFLGSLGESVLDGVAGEDPGDTNEDVRTRNDLKGDRSRIGETIDTLTLRWSVNVARGPLVDELSENGGILRGKSSCEETGADALDGGDVDSHLPGIRVDEVVEDGDGGDDGDGVQVLDQAVGVPCRIIPAATRTRVTIDLAQPGEGELTGHLASLEGMTNFANELVVPGDPGRDDTPLLDARAWRDHRNQT